MPLALYLRDQCSICDAAIELLAAARAGDFDSIHVDEDADLDALYGESVPVLRDGSGRELAWPFDAESLGLWLTSRVQVD